MKSLATLIESAVIYLVGQLTQRNGRAVTLPREAAEQLGWVLSPDGLNGVRPFRLACRQRSRHTYILGATGCGKTNLILELLARDVEAGQTVVVIDLRGDLVDRVLALLADRNSPCAAKVTLLDLRDAKRIIGFNPLSGSGDAHARAYLVLDALRAQSDSWGVQLEETLRNGLIALAEQDLTLLELEPLLSDASFRENVLSRSDDPSVRAFFARYGELSRERQQSWLLPVLNKVTPLLGTPRLRLLLGAPNRIDFKKDLDSPGHMVLVALSVDRLHSAGRLVGSLIIGEIESAVTSRVDQPESTRTPVSLYVDEFESMATEAFETLIAEGRRFGLSLTLSHQNLSQISSSLRSVIRNNAQTQVFFQTGSVDARELRHELSSGEIEDPVAALQSLPVGHAFVCKRPEEPLLVRFDRHQRPKASPIDVDRLANEVHRSMGSLSAEDVLNKTNFSLERTPGPSKVMHSRLPRRGGQKAE